ncbi:hypothetical protein D9615_010577 [Tricholomella constricta]|uniref:Ndc10 domain-containing protein n=1 Tax=Tricholomella constricta TaxID=117010 RepID=A0A8H5LSE4_9AGAR|nr:hypothetical protein D9615_010577 [Tricholomella constricta]
MDTMTSTQHRKAIGVVKAELQKAFDAEPEELRQELIAERDAFKKGKAASVEPGGMVKRTAEQYASAIECIPDAMFRLTESLGQQTGWIWTIIGGGPDPVNGGKPTTLAFHYGENEVSHSFRKAYGDYNKKFLRPYAQFVESVFPLSVCKSRMLHNNKDDDATLQTLNEMYSMAAIDDADNLSIDPSLRLPMPAPPSVPPTSLTTLVPSPSLSSPMPASASLVSFAPSTSPSSPALLTSIASPSASLVSFAPSTSPSSPASLASPMPATPQFSPAAMPAPISIPFVSSLDPTTTTTTLTSVPIPFMSLPDPAATPASLPIPLVPPPDLSGAVALDLSPQDECHVSSRQVPERPTSIPFIFPSDMYPTDQPSSPLFSGASDHHRQTSPSPNTDWEALLVSLKKLPTPPTPPAPKVSRPRKPRATKAAPTQETNIESGPSGRGMRARKVPATRECLGSLDRLGSPSRLADRVTERHLRPPPNCAPTLGLELSLSLGLSPNSLCTRPSMSLPTTPPKAVHLDPGQAQSPLSRKRTRLTSAEVQFVPYAPLPPLLFDSSPPVQAVATTATPVNTKSTTSLLDRAQRSKDLLHAEAHQKRKEYAVREQEDKGTKASYGRHVSAYQLWWDTVYQPCVVTADPTREVLPSFPITAAKVMMYLDYEATRPKRKQGSKTMIIEGSFVGRSHLKQVISALEHHRLNHQSDYPNDFDAQRPLRWDERIKKFEDAISHNEPMRVEKSQALKAAGTIADTYTREQLIQCSIWCLKNFSGPRQTFVGVRDRAMLLVSSSIAFRGDSSRDLLWSDLFFVDVPMNDIHLGAEVKALVILADNAKTNQDGRVDEHGAFRHRFVELCPQCVLSPDFEDPGYGEYGRREWYEHYVFSTSSISKAMSYDNHRDRVNLLHAKNNVHISKVTHGGRTSSARIARENGASSDGTKALGGWSESGSFRRCYDRTLPVDALLGAAMFNGRKPETYFVPRACLDPPCELSDALFPWVEAEIDVLDERRNADRLSQDIVRTCVARRLQSYSGTTEADRPDVRQGRRPTKEYSEVVSVDGGVHRG